MNKEWRVYRGSELIFRVPVMLPEEASHEMLKAVQPAAEAAIRKARPDITLSDDNIRTLWCNSNEPIGAEKRQG